MKAKKNQDELQFEINNLGSIKKGEFTQKPLTLFCGSNNTGKTWTMYSLYHFYGLLKSATAYIQDNPVHTTTLKRFNKQLSNSLPFLFNADSEEIRNAKFNFLANKDEDFNHFLRDNNSNDFLIPAERSGLHLFFRELSTKRTALLHHASQKKININELLKDVIRSRYAIPIGDYINFLNSLVEIKKSKKKDFNDYAKEIQKKLVQGSYKVDSNTGDISFKPKSISKDNKPDYLDLHLTSSTVKSLFGLWFYLNYRAKPGDILMIDEPELNLHPENQRVITRILAQLVNAGLKVVISTHSDYIVREFNSLIMLNQDKKGELQKKHKYHSNEILSPEKVGAYLFDKQTIKPFKISSDDGIYATTFDEVIKKINEVNNDIYYSLQETKE